MKPLPLVFVIALAAAAAACGQKPSVESTGTAAVVPTVATNTPDQSIAPAIIPPAEVADPTEPPSYEVAIASAAATRNKALERCSNQPDAVRTQCEQEANAAFADAEASLQNLRGNTP